LTNGAQQHDKVLHLVGDFQKKRDEINKSQYIIGLWVLAGPETFGKLVLV
jgi:hypothetical protein